MWGCLGVHQVLDLPHVVAREVLAWYGVQSQVTKGWWGKEAAQACQKVLKPQDREEADQCLGSQEAMNCYHPSFLENRVGQRGKVSYCLCCYCFDQGAHHAWVPCRAGDPACGDSVEGAVACLAENG